MQKSLNKQTIIVIGGSSGIGWAVAKICYEQGANVSLSSRVLAKAQAAAQAIGDTVQALELDVDEEEAVNACLANFDQIDHIYIAAGSTKLGGVLDGSLLDNMQAFQTRLLGSLRIVRAA
ncbi:MAG: SDR family NAD(P)-dependent oxidoreductase, partial [Bacteroidota bacterium]